jgi:hypothetical protein
MASDGVSFSAQQSDSVILKARANPVQSVFEKRQFSNTLVAGLVIDVAFPLGSSRP